MEGVKKIWTLNQRLSKKITLTNLSGGVVLFEVEISLFQFIDTRFSQVLQQQSVMKNEKLSQTLFRDPNFSFENIFDFYRICNGHIPVHVNCSDIELSW